MLTQFKLPYFLQITTRSLLSSLLVEFLLGGEFPVFTLLFRDLLNLAISSPNTSPVLSADIKSSNSPLSPFFSPLFRLRLLLMDDNNPSRLCFLSKVSFFNSASCLARFSSSSCRLRIFSLSCLASEKAFKNVSKIPKNSSGWALVASSPNSRTALSKRFCKKC